VSLILHPGPPSRRIIRWCHHRRCLKTPKRPQLLARPLSLSAKVKLPPSTAPARLPNLECQEDSERGRGKRKRAVTKRFEQAKEDGLV
jgi:hypothetical protein